MHDECSEIGCKEEVRISTVKKSDNGWAEAAFLEGNTILHSTKNETNRKDHKEGSDTRYRFQRSQNPEQTTSPEANYSGQTRSLAGTKNATQERVDWLEKNARNIARAEGELDWKKKMNDMARLAKERGVNRKLTNATKGTRQSLDRIEVPKYEWFYSQMTKELYHYDSGVFEAYAAQTPQVGLQPTHPVSFYTHHHLKVLPEDATRASVQQNNNEIRLMALYLPCKLWTEVTEPNQIESIILA